MSKIVVPISRKFKDPFRFVVGQENKHPQIQNRSRGMAWPSYYVAGPYGDRQIKYGEWVLPYETGGGIILSHDAYMALFKDSANTEEMQDRYDWEAWQEDEITSNHYVGFSFVERIKILFGWKWGVQAKTRCEFHPGRVEGSLKDHGWEAPKWWEFFFRPKPMCGEVQVSAGPPAELCGDYDESEEWDEDENAACICGRYLIELAKHREDCPQFEAYREAKARSLKLRPGQGHMDLKPHPWAPGPNEPMPPPIGTAPSSGYLEERFKLNPKPAAEAARAVSRALNCACDTKDGEHHPACPAASIGEVYPPELEELRSPLGVAPGHDPREGEAQLIEALKNDGCTCGTLNRGVSPHYPDCPQFESEV